jgi:hypothetical protein
MSVSSDFTLTGTIDDGRALLSSTFLEFCAKVRGNDLSILPAAGKPLRIRHLSEKVELADALLENNSVTYLELEARNFTKSSAEAMAKYVRISRRLQRIHWNGELNAGDRELQLCEEILCYFLPAFQESTSLKELHINFRLIGGPSNLALENTLTHTQSLRSLSLLCPVGRLYDIRSGLTKNTTLRKLTLEFSWGDARTEISSLLTSPLDHPLLRRLCLRGNMTALTGLETVLRSEHFQITELEIHKSYGGLRMMGLTHVLQALAHRPTLTKLGLHGFRLSRDETAPDGIV